MKKSMLNVITLALVLINLILTVLLTFSLVSTNNKTNNLITKVAQIIDLDIGETTVKDDTTSAGANIADIAYVDVKNNDSTDITVSYTDGGKTHYAVLNVTVGFNTKAKDYEEKKSSLENSMKVVVSQVNTCVGVEDRCAGIAEEVARNDCVFGVAEHAFELAFCSLFHGSADSLFCGGFSEVDSQVDNRYVESGDTHRDTGQFAVEFGKNFTYSLGSTCRRGDDVARSSTTAAPVFH